MYRYDVLVVGAGLTGAVIAERLASERGLRVLVVDRRDHVGGNVYDEQDAHGIRVHRYGPHLFHTNAERVWRYLSRFTAWRPYEHHVLGRLGDGTTIPLPVNLDALRVLRPGPAGASLEQALVGAYGDGAHVPILRLLEATDPDVRGFAEEVYERVFLGYTTKHWGMRPEELGPSVTGRVPIRLSRDARYFQDRYQAIPRAGYTAMLGRILDHPNIRVATGTAYTDVPRPQYDRLVYTGPLDAFFDYAYGALPYRSLRFVFEHHERGLRQAVAQINHPDAPGFTRVTEYRHVTGQRHEGTTLSREFPEAHVPGLNEPYYPVPIESARTLYRRYAALAIREAPDTLFAGRLADYKYYNMDQAVARALAATRRDPLPYRADPSS